MRKPKKTVPNWQPEVRSDVNTQVRRYKLITPLYGGGVKAGEVDTVTPIRGTAVRGQLRFWWRAIRGGQFDGNLAKMKEKEDEIWGSASTPSQVSLVISYPDENSKQGSAFEAVDEHGRSKPIGDPASTTGYATFPLRDKEQNILEGISFVLNISFSETISEEVRAALWAWEHFGGIGARTRRGFGALECTQVDENGETLPLTLFTVANVKQKLIEEFETHCKGINFPDNIPYLPADLDQRIKIKRFSGDSSTNTWIKLVQALQTFRQERPQNRVQEGNRTFIRPGRNRWPEPDAIRDKVDEMDKVNKVKPRHRKYPKPLYSGGISKAPRAAFGLPILFEFKGEGTMPKVTLKGEKHDRFASPLILRPLACRDGKYVGLALILSGSDVSNLPSDLILEGVSNSPPIKSKLTQPEADQIAAKHSSYNGNIDILQAFLDSL
ncbi:MAG: type III-B CRISPR module RAMP protein Cmr1 [Anaerolineales bacterium]|nr:type III-B CRISPR module RAMP protein Cmr1 [Anaerolineales bacterium]